MRAHATLAYVRHCGAATSRQAWLCAIRMHSACTSQKPMHGVVNAPLQSGSTCWGNRVRWAIASIPPRMWQPHSRQPGTAIAEQCFLPAVPPALQCVTRGPRSAAPAFASPVVCARQTNRIGPVTKADASMRTSATKSRARSQPRPP